MLDEEEIILSSKSLVFLVLHQTKPNSELIQI
jgi:hypothetical protein